MVVTTAGPKQFTREFPILIAAANVLHRVPLVIHGEPAGTSKTP